MTTQTENQLLHAFELKTTITHRKFTNSAIFYIRWEEKHLGLIPIAVDHSLADKKMYEIRTFFLQQSCIAVSSFCYPSTGGLSQLSIQLRHTFNTITSRPRTNQGCLRDPLRMGGQQTMSQISVKYKQCDSAPNLPELRYKVNDINIACFACDKSKWRT